MLRRFGVLSICIVFSHLLRAGEAADLDVAMADVLLNAPAEALAYPAMDTGITATQRSVYEVYHETGLQPLWVTADGPGPQAQAVLKLIASAADEGLDPEAYHYTALQALWPARNPASLARLDLLISVALCRWVNDVSVGRVQVDPVHQDRYVDLSGRRIPGEVIITNFIGAADPVVHLQQMLPQHRYYRGLRLALYRYRELEAAGGWPSVPSEVATLHPGEQGDWVAGIRSRLAMTGEYGGTERDSTLYDEPLQEAVREFQLMHGLAPDGVLGPQTVAAMNRTVTYRREQIELNMERWRAMAHDLGNPYLLVDIAGYDVQGVVDDVTEIEMRVIVGKLHHETPIFSDSIKYIEFNPYWNLTPSIARHETVPRVRKDINYLRDKHIRVFDGWGAGAVELDPHQVDWDSVNPGAVKFRQDPGPWNALGTVKFIFPNQYSVYLHDTPNHDLFDRAERDFSHGCIRLSEPAQLAEWILARDQSGWGKTEIDAVFASQSRTVKNLDSPMAVHLSYETAWIDGDSRLRFAPDIYGRDVLLRKALLGQ